MDVGEGRSQSRFAGGRASFGAGRASLTLTRGGRSQCRRQCCCRAVESPIALKNVSQLPLQSFPACFVFIWTSTLIINPAKHIMAETLMNYIASQAALVQEAAEALPHQFTHCTYSLGHIRQAVYLCQTCAAPRGICSACSIACHTDHEQLELFPKRHFRCDCPTASLSHACTLYRTPEGENASNPYGKNFQGVFCRCGRHYDASLERETMIQCLVCEVSLGSVSPELHSTFYAYRYPARNNH